MARGITDDLTEYFKSVESWDTQQALAARSEKRLAYMVAIVALIAAIAAIILYLLSPLKITEPYVIRVEERTGAVDVISVATDTEKITGDEAVRKYFLADYVRSRESWIKGASDELFRKTMSLSSQQTGQKYRALRDAQNPKSPINVYRGNETANIVVRSISFLSDNVGQVRFSRMVSGGGLTDERSDWVATIQFEFANKPTSDLTRFYNPLGFLVTSYRIDSEMVGAGE